ncbi:MAG: aspartate aminotransferase family protein [Geminicoccaceae bacterium]
MSEVARKRIIELTRRHESTAVNTFTMSDDPPLFVRGEGPFLFTREDERYVDLVAGSAVTNLGHGLPAHRDAIERVLEQGIYHTGTRLLNVERAELYGELAEVLPPSLPRVHFVSAGTEAVETAIKASQYHTKRRRIFAFEGGYHGRTVGSLSLTHAEALHKTFMTLSDVVTFIPFPYKFRSEPPETDEEKLTAFCLQTLEDKLEEAKAANDLPSSIILEAIQGTSGAVRPPTGFLKSVRDLATAYDVLLVVDEIWTGFGRTGAWFGFEHDYVEPDLVCLSKGLTAGMPLAGVAGREDILGNWPAGIHTSTFQGTPVACAMARATLAEMKQGRLVEHAAGPVQGTFGQYLKDLETLPHVRDVRWIGAAAAIEFQEQDGSPSPSIRLQVQENCFEQKLLVYGGGRQKNTIMLLPPINIDPGVLGDALGLIAKAVEDPQ